MTRENISLNNEAFNALMVRVVVTIFAAVAILLLLSVVTRPAPAARNTVAQGCPISNSSIV